MRTSPRLDTGKRRPYCLLVARSSLRRWLLGAGLVLAGGCPSEQQRDTRLPLLTGLEFDGAAAESPTVLLFHADFRDSDGNLGAGELQPYINGKAAGDALLPLRDVFIDSGVPLDATVGTLQLVLEVQLSAGNLPQEGARFDVGFKVTDADGNGSNVPASTLEIYY